MGRARRIQLRYLVAFLLPFLAVQCSDLPSDSEALEIQIVQPEETTDGWQTATLSSVGMSQDPLVNLVRSIESGVYREIHSIVIVKNSKLVFERYWPGHDFAPFATDYHGAYTQFDRDTRHNTHSATKSIVSALVGIAIDRDMIRTQEDSVFSYLPASYGVWRTQGRESITLEHCLMMASGLQWNEWDTQVTSSANDLMIFNQSTDPIGYLLSKPIATVPGTTFYYNGATVDLLGTVLSTASEQRVESFSSKYLFGPLGITNYHWVVLRPSGITCCHGDIHITPRDMAKFGQLFLNNGMWKGTQVISKEWVERSTQYHINPMVPWADGYGYLWWLRNIPVNNRTATSFKAMGWGGQEIFVLKDLAMVVVFTGANYVGSVPCDEIMQRYVLPSAGM